MIKLNDNGIFVGQIKQILKDFNLPKCHCNDDILVNNSYYIDRNKIYRVIDNKKELTGSTYTFGKRYLNITTNFDFESLYYDIETHKYLGDYLRFIRDYYNVNLMSMYNCSINKTVDRDITLYKEYDSNNKETKEVWSYKDNIIYIVPIKFNQVYTIGVDYPKVEICACLYNEKKDIVVQADKELYNNSYTILRNCSLDRPILYDKLKDYYNVNKDLFTKESTLKLLIKLPKGYSNSVVVLEGDYTQGCSQSYQNKVCKYIFNRNAENAIPEDTLKGIINSQIRPQLMSYNNLNNNYLLADRLVEYLTGNVISSISQDYDIEKVQKWGLFNSESLYENKQVSKELDTLQYGLWNNDLTRFLYELNQLELPQNGYVNIPYDSIGYVDKDLERKLECLGDSELNAENGIVDYGGIV